MENKVLELDDYRPHINVYAPTRVHTIPVSFFFDYAAGKREITDMEGWEEVVKVIVGEWLKSILNKS